MSVGARANKRSEPPRGSNDPQPSVPPGLTLHDTQPTDKKITRLVARAQKGVGAMCWAGHTERYDTDTAYRNSMQAQTPPTPRILVFASGENAEPSPTQRFERPWESKDATAHITLSGNLLDC